MTKEKVLKFLNEINSLATRIDENPKSPNRTVSKELQTSLQNITNDIGDISFPDYRTEAEVLEMDVAILKALEKAYQSAKGVSPHSFFKKLNSETLNIGLGSDFKEGISKIIATYFNEGRELKNTTKFMNQQIEIRQNELDGWIQPDVNPRQPG